MRVGEEKKTVRRSRLLLSFGLQPEEKNFGLFVKEAGGVAGAYR